MHAVNVYKYGQVKNNSAIIAHIIIEYVESVEQPDTYIHCT